jgi:tetratricopeptide (TPR) repeat protein
MRKQALICAVALAAAGSLSARQINPATPPPPPPAGAPAAKPADPSTPPPPPESVAAPPAAQPIDPSTPPPPPSTDAPDAFADPSEPVFDPLHAERSLDVGEYYLKTGKIDAAIDRFIEAAHYEPNLARPWRFLGEAYEKKGANANAVESYKKYLEILPGAEDAKKIQKRISALEEKTEKESPKAAAH